MFELTVPDLYSKTTFGPRMSGLHKHTKLLKAESVAYNENKLIQELVDEEIKYPYTLQDLGNRKYRQTIPRTRFTENIVAELMKRGFTHAQLDKHIKQVRNRFGFDMRKSGSRRGKHTTPSKMPEIIFVEEKMETVLTTTGVSVPTTSSATPAKPSTNGSTPTTSTSTETTDTIEQTIGRITITDPRSATEDRPQLPIISTVFYMSTAGSIEDPEIEQATELEYVSTVTQDFEPYDPKEKLSSCDLEIKKELIEEDLQPQDPEYYPKLQYVYQNLQKGGEAVDSSKNTSSYNDNLRNYNSISQILENMKTAYFYYAEHTGKVLPKGWDMVELAKAVLPKGAKGMRIPAEEDDPDYHLEPIDKWDATTMGLKQIKEYMDKFDKELGELKKIMEKGTAKDYTRAKMNRREELENKFSEFDIERENRLARRGGSRREGGTSEEVDPESQEKPENPEDQSALKSSWDQLKPERGTYPAPGPNSPGDLNVEGDWEGPIELFKSEYDKEGWVNCTTDYYWHSVLGGGIYLYEDEWYRNREFDYEPPEEEIVQDEPEDIEGEDPEIPPEEEIIHDDPENIEGEHPEISQKSPGKRTAEKETPVSRRTRSQ